MQVDHKEYWDNEFWFKKLNVFFFQQNVRYIYIRPILYCLTQKKG